MTQTSITSTDFQALVIASLADADPSALASLQTKIPFFWALYARQAYLPELRYWYVRRAGIRVLMGCLNKEVDYIRRHSNLGRTSFQNMRQDSNMAASSLEDGSGHTDRAMNSHYDDAMDASGSGSSSRRRNSNESAADDMSYTDSGRGANSGQQDSSLSATSSDNGATQDHNHWDSNESRSRSGARTVNNHMSQDGVTIVAASVTRTNRSGSDSSDTNENSDANRHTDYTASQDDERHADSSQQATQVADSQFQANAVSSEAGATNLAMTGSGSAASQDDMAGAGRGTMTSTGSGATADDAAGSRAAHSDGESHAGMQATSQMNSTMERLHQRFLHLQLLWKDASDMIEWLEKQRLALSPYVIRQITIQYPEGVGADVANAFLVKQPCGRM